jgi:hypothetical protein
MLIKILKKQLKRKPQHKQWTNPRKSLNQARRN